MYYEAFKGQKIPLTEKLQNKRDMPYCTHIYQRETVFTYSIFIASLHLMENVVKIQGKIFTENPQTITNLLIITF